MRSLESHHIIDLFVLVDDLLPSQYNPAGGRHSLLSDSELVTLLVWNELTMKQKLLVDIHRWAKLHMQHEFKRLPKYNGFLAQCHRVLPKLLFVLQTLLNHQANITWVDSTMLEVCKLQRADEHRVAKAIAKYGKNYQGWHYGLKLHASIDQDGRLCGIHFTPANQHDSQALPKILNKHQKIAVGDGSYNASVMNTWLFETEGVFVLSPPHPKQTKKITTDWQRILLNMRSKIESTFDELKNHLNLVSSFPRSIRGYLLHWVRILLGYQVMHI